MENNYPRLNLITKENETDDDILARVKIKGDEIINSLLKIKSNRNKRGRNKNNHGKVYSTRKIRKTKGSRSGTNFPSDSEAEESYSGTENKEMEDNLPPLTESEGSESEEEDSENSASEDNDAHGENLENITTDCNCCTLKIEFPPELKTSDQVLINRESGEILIFPQDEVENEEDWIQDCIIKNSNQNPIDSKILYGKGDSQKLENFLKQ